MRQAGLLRISHRGSVTAFWDIPESQQFNS